jgi:outer membrane receptor protein involved in Fe transport
VAGAFQHDGTPQQNKSTSAYSTEKVSYQMNPAFKLIGFHQKFYRDSEEEITAFTDFDSRQKNSIVSTRSRLKRRSCRVTGSCHCSMEAGAGISAGHRARAKNGRPYSDQIGTFDQLTSLVTGLNDEAATLTYGGRQHVRGAVNWYKPDLFAGNHDFKAGVDYLPRNGFDRRAFDRGVAENYRLIFRGGVPFDIDVKNNPVDPKTPYTSLGTYAQDRWTIGRRLTLNLGGRFAYDNGYIPRQCRTAARAPFDVVFRAGCFDRIQFRKRLHDGTACLRRV